MGRKKLTAEPTNLTPSEILYAKNKDAIVKKASELSVLCDTDVGLILFSPTGHLTTFSSTGRVEDIFLRVVDRSDALRGHIGNEEYLRSKLKQLKYEGEMLKRIAIKETLEEELDKLNRKEHEAKEKMRLYEPDIEKINSLLEAEAHEKFLTDAIRSIQLSKVKLLGNHVGLQRSENIETYNVNMEDTALKTDYSSQQMQNRSHVEIEGPAGTSSSMGSHLSLNFIQSQKEWKAMGGEMAPKK